MVSDQQRPLHGLRGDLESLDDEGGAEQRQDHRHQERFDVLAQRGVLFLFLPPYRRLHLRDVGGLGHLAVHLSSFCPANCSSARRAAACSASFLLLPMPEAMACPARHSSTAKVLRCSGPLWLTTRYSAGGMPRPWRNSWSADLWSVRLN